MPNQPPKTLEELKAIPDDEDRIAASTAYLQRVEQAGKDARHVRDQAIRNLAERLGPSEAARRAHVSLATVKAIRRNT